MFAVWLHPRFLFGCSRSVRSSVGLFDRSEAPTHPKHVLVCNVLDTSHINMLRTVIVPAA
jgi:hypothetical protein